MQVRAQSNPADRSCEYSTDALRDRGGDQYTGSACMVERPILLIVRAHAESPSPPTVQRRAL
jgi:hypothetical protein